MEAFGSYKLHPCLVRGVRIHGRRSVCVELTAGRTYMLSMILDFSEHDWKPHFLVPRYHTIMSFYVHRHRRKFQVWQKSAGTSWVRPLYVVDLE